MRSQNARPYDTASSQFAQGQNTKQGGSRCFVFWAVAGRTQAAEGKLATSFFAAEIGLDPILAFAKNSGALVMIVTKHGKRI